MYNHILALSQNIFLSLLTVLPSATRSCKKLYYDFLSPVFPFLLFLLFIPNFSVYM